jgi:hypothetical protein
MRSWRAASAGLVKSMVRMGSCSMHCHGLRIDVHAVDVIQQDALAFGDGQPPVAAGGLVQPRGAASGPLLPAQRDCIQDSYIGQVGGAVAPVFGVARFG